MTYKSEEISPKLLEYENKIMNLEIENKTLQLIEFELDQKKSLIKELEKRIASLIEENSRINNLNKQLEVSFMKQMNENYFKSTNAVGYLEEEVNDMKQKLKTFNQAINYINTLEKINSNLYEEIKELKENFKNSLIIEHENYKDKFYEETQKLLKMIKNIKLSVQKNTIDSLPNSSKILLLQNSLLNEELGKNSMIVEDLLLKLRKKNDIITSLKTDNEVNNKIRSSLISGKQPVGDVLRSMFRESMRNKNKLGASKSVTSKEEDKTVENKRKMTDIQMRKTSNSVNFKDLLKCNDISSRNSNYDTDIKVSSKYLTGFGDSSYKQKNFFQENLNVIEIFIENISRILKDNIITKEMIDNIENSVVNEIMKIVYSFYCSLKLERKDKITVTKKIIKKPNSILDKYEKFLDEKCPKIVKFKIK